MDNNVRNWLFATGPILLLAGLIGTLLFLFCLPGELAESSFRLRHVVRLLIGLLICLTVLGLAAIGAGTFAMWLSTRTAARNAQRADERAEQARRALDAHLRRIEQLQRTVYGKDAKQYLTELEKLETELTRHLAAKARTDEAPSDTDVTTAFRTLRDSLLPK